VCVCVCSTGMPSSGTRARARARTHTHTHTACSHAQCRRSSTTMQPSLTIHPQKALFIASFCFKKNARALTFENFFLCGSSCSCSTRKRRRRRRRDGGGARVWPTCTASCSPEFYESKGPGWHQVSETSRVPPSPSLPCCRSLRVDSRVSDQQSEVCFYMYIYMYMYVYVCMYV
jgi:hypothetical protein